MGIQGAALLTPPYIIGGGVSHGLISGTLKFNPPPSRGARSGDAYPPPEGGVSAYNPPRGGHRARGANTGVAHSTKIISGR
jgi:hypothetical protein